jgi:hypothetical protein
MQTNLVCKPILVVGRRLVADCRNEATQWHFVRIPESEVADIQIGPVLRIS